MEVEELGDNDGASTIALKSDTLMGALDTIKAEPLELEVATNVGAAMTGVSLANEPRAALLLLPSVPRLEARGEPGERVGEEGWDCDVVEGDNGPPTESTFFWLRRGPCQVPL